MSWVNVRGQIVSTIEALTPTSTSYGGKRFRHVKEEQIEESKRDRSFVVRMSTPPLQVGQIINGVSWRFTTTCEIIINYNRSATVAIDENRISQDCEQIQKALLLKSGHHSDVEGVVAAGSSLLSADIDETPQRNYRLGIALTIHHL